ncbi:hypothetical protein D3OALGB2SA_3175 [Olavius algarvensis associated proteobacterium Delta 3]|nr:hypothetical protein D3OALGB2SA_3175 [Olavius algarvensis associated proteobacterium Delta 3]
METQFPRFPKLWRYAALRLLGGRPPTEALSAPRSAVMALCKQHLSIKLGDLSGELFLERLERRPQKTLQAAVLVLLKLKVASGAPVRGGPYPTADTRKQASAFGGIRVAGHCRRKRNGNRSAIHGCAGVAYRIGIGFQGYPGAGPVDQKDRWTGSIYSGNFGPPHGALGMFRKIGLDPIPAPTDFVVRKGIPWHLYLAPSVGGIGRAEMAVHEYAGILWAKLRRQM